MPMEDDGIERRWYGGIGIPVAQIKAAVAMMQYEDKNRHPTAHYEWLLDIGLHELWPDEGPTLATGFSIEYNP